MIRNIVNREVIRERVVEGVDVKILRERDVEGKSQLRTKLMVNPHNISVKIYSPCI